MKITESRFAELMAQFGNGADIYNNGKKINVYTFGKKMENKYYISYHLYFLQKNIQFNFWFNKLNYLNPTESVTISCYNRDEILEKNRLKNIFKTECFDELTTKTNEIFNINK